VQTDIWVGVHKLEGFRQMIDARALAYTVMDKYNWDTTPVVGAQTDGRTRSNLPGELHGCDRGSQAGGHRWYCASAPSGKAGNCLVVIALSFDVCIVVLVNAMAAGQPGDARSTLRQHQDVAAWPRPAARPGIHPPRWGCHERMRHHHGDKWRGA
jgi:hypothetical protein